MPGRLERALIAAGEAVIRVPPALTVDARRAARTPGKSDPIDAHLAVLYALQLDADKLPTPRADADRARRGAYVGLDPAVAS